MPVIENLCPRCGAVPYPGPPQAYPDGQIPVPEDGMLLNCPRCGFLGIWEAFYWRAPSDAERLQLLHDAQVLEAQFLPMMAALCRQADIERIDEILRHHLDVPGLNVTGDTIAEIIVDLRIAGFHTHRKPFDMSNEGDDDGE